LQINPQSIDFGYNAGKIDDEEEGGGVAAVKSKREKCDEGEQPVFVP
jgi:hypothetical protein